MPCHAPRVETDQYFSFLCPAPLFSLILTLKAPPIKEIVALMRPLYQSMPRPL